MEELKVGEREMETILWLNFLPEDDVRAIEDVREFYGKCSVVEEARQIDLLNKLWKQEEE